MRYLPQLLSVALGMTIAAAHAAPGQTPGAASEASRGAAHPATFSLSTHHEPVISLDGLWRFHAGDDARWASPEFDDTGWALLRSDQPWSVQGYDKMSGFGWYRFSVDAGDISGPLAILLPSILTDYEVFENGRKVGGFGQMPPHGSLRFNQRMLYALDPVAAGSAIHIALRVWHHPTFASYLGGGPRYGGAGLGDRAVLEERLRQSQAERSSWVVDYFTVGILQAVISITVFGLYLYRRSEREYLWFAIVLLTGALQVALTISDFLLNFPLGVHDFTAETLGAVGIAAALLFFSRVLEARRTPVWRAVLVIALLDPLNVGLYVLRYASSATSTSLRVLFDVPIEIYIVALLLRRAWAGNRNARLLFVPTVLLYGTGVLGGLVLLLFQMGWQSRAVNSISQWNVTLTPYPVQLGALTQLVFIVALLAFLIRRFAQSRGLEERYSADLEAARTLQQVLIPEALPALPGLAVTTAYHPAQEVGGDFYQILPVEPAVPGGAADTLIVLGDVAGKGLPAAMTVSMLVGALRSLVETTGSPGEVLAGLNRRLLGRGSGFTTCLAMRVSSSGVLTLSNAGHLAPYRNGEELFSPPALPLGLDPGADYPEQVYQLAHGDRITVLTDGVPEATRRHELLGFERTAELSTLPAAAIAEAALEFGQSDDITVLSIVADHGRRS